jgi:hypothetical protein
MTIAATSFGELTWELEKRHVILVINYNNNTYLLPSTRFWVFFLLTAVYSCSQKPHHLTSKHTVFSAQGWHSSFSAFL